MSVEMFLMRYANCDLKIVLLLGDETLYTGRANDFIIKCNSCGGRGLRKFKMNSIKVANSIIFIDCYVEGK